MNPVERVQLDKLIKVNDAVDNTHNIRTLKHSDNIRADIQTMTELKNQLLPSFQLAELCASKCSFIYKNYNDIYNKCYRNELDINIMWKLLDLLKQIEDNQHDQHTASFEVGKLLKQIYIDGAISPAPAPTNPEKNISWLEFKKKQL